MADYEQYYQKSIEALTLLIKEKKEIPTEKDWNRMAVEKGYLTSQSIGFIAQAKFPQLCKTIYKEIQKQIKKEKKNEYLA